MPSPSDQPARHSEPDPVGAQTRAYPPLSDADLGGRLLGCGDGPASFNAEATARGADRMLQLRQPGSSN